MLSRVLIATDASEVSDRMLDCVSDLRKVGGKEALLVHVFDVRHVAGLYPRMRELMMPRLLRQSEVLLTGGLPSAG